MTIRLSSIAVLTGFALIAAAMGHRIEGEQMPYMIVVWFWCAWYDVRSTRKRKDDT